MQRHMIIATYPDSYPSIVGVYVLRSSAYTRLVQIAHIRRSAGEEVEVLGGDTPWAIEVGELDENGSGSRCTYYLTSVEFD